MRRMTKAELGLLLLCVLPGETPPLSEHRYEELRQMAKVLGPENPDPETELDQKELLHLGCTEEEAARILSRLERERELAMYLKHLEKNRIQLLTCLSPEYPNRLREKLGGKAPLKLYCMGNAALLSKPCISLVGSRKLRARGRSFSRQAGSAIAAQGFGYCSGGAAGADTVGYQAAIANGGCAVLFLADSLLRHRYDRRYLCALEQDRLLLVSEFGADHSFTAAGALARNRLIHAMGEKVLVAQTDYTSGGTWNGTVENLRSHWSPVFVSDGEPEDPGTRGLLEQGAEPVSVRQLQRLDLLCPRQIGMFE